MNKNLEKIIELNSKLTHLKQKIKEENGGGNPMGGGMPGMM